MTNKKKAAKKNDPFEGLVLFVCNECGRIAYAEQNTYLACGFCSQRKGQPLQPMSSRWDAELARFDFAELTKSTIGVLGR